MVVKIMPMKVLLVVRGEPSFLGFVDDAGGSASASSPLFSVETAEDLSSLAPSQAAEEKCPYEACVLPASLFLELQSFSLPVPAIVYGGIDVAWPCLDAGAFDFMREGWTLLELEARLYRLFSPIVDCMDGFLALQGRMLVWRTRGSDELPTSMPLTPGEAELLRRLLAGRGWVAGAGSLGGGTRALAMRVSRLKAKLSALHEGLGTNIEAVRGAGYRWISSPRFARYGRPASSNAR